MNLKCEFVAYVWRRGQYLQRGRTRAAGQTRTAGLFAVIVAASLGLIASVEAAPTTRADAALVVRAWQKGRPRPLGTQLGTAVREIHTYSDHDGAPLYYVVSLDPSGFVVVPADDEVDPILAFAPTGTYDPSLANPLAALVSGDLSARKRLLSAKNRQSQLVVRASKARTKWALLTGTPPATTKSGSTPTDGIIHISDEWVSPLVVSEWNQSTVGAWVAPQVGEQVACYNYYTPPFDAGASSNYLCGCTATATAQLMRYHRYPTTSVGTGSFLIQINFIPALRNLRGGDGAGGPYAWDQMPLIPTCDISDAQRRAIGSVTHDVGVAAGANYGGEGTGAALGNAVNNLVSVFHYANAVSQGFPLIGIGTNDLYRIVNPNLDARCPVLFSIRAGLSGHAVVCDGYGFDAGTLYHHINLGWSGSSTAWYTLPDIPTSSYDFNVIDGCGYNIFPSVTGEIISGRLTDAGGLPIANVTVQADNQTHGTCLYATTDESGIFALKGVDSGCQYLLTVLGTGYSPPSRTVATGQSSGLGCGNVWGADFAASFHLNPWISGRITETTAGTGMEGVSVLFSNGGGVATTGPDGTYSNQVLYDWSGTITPSKANCTFSPTTISLSNVHVAQRDKDFSGHLTSIPVTGRITRQDNGLGLDGVSVVFSAGGGTVTTTGGGYFSNSMAYGWAGTVTPTLTAWQFTPSTYTFASPLTAPPAAVAFTATQVSVKQIEATPDAFAVLEGSSFGGLKVRLSQNPGATVVVSVQRVSGDTDLNVTSGNTLSFNASNWQTYQWVQVSASEDADKLSGTAVIRCSASGWASKDVVASETDNDGGSVRVYIEPAEARSAGAQWRAQGGAWHNSGEIDDTLPFFTDITVQYKDIAGWFTPPVQHATLNSITPSVTFTGTYNRAATGTGNVRININPASASAAGARWRVDSGTWMNSGDSVYGLAAGNHTIDFASATGYVRPASQTVNVNGGNTTENLGLYSPTGSCVYVSAGQSIQTAIDNAVAGQTIILNDGTFNIAERILLSKGVTLRSLNGPAAVSVVLPSTRTHCISVGHTNAFVDGITFRGADNYQGQGGGAYCGQGTMLNCKATGNLAFYGAGICCGNNAVLYNCWLEGNESYREGAGLYLTGNSRAFSCVLKNNTVRNDYEGGGFYADGGYLYNCLVTGNGTGTYGDGAGGYARNAVVDRCVIAGNTAEDSGGGLVLGTGAVLDSAQVQNNSARNAGGIYCDSGALVIRNCRITGNHATQANGIGGGGCWGDDGTVITNCTIAGNTSAYFGGGLASFGNFAAYNTVFSNNTAQAQGGAIYSEGQNTLVNCLLCRNSASGDGGGFWNNSGSPAPTINNSTICYNTAGGRGGGVYFDANPRAPLVRNSIVMNNTATGGNANYFELDTGDVRFEYSCTTPLPTGTGNINSSPLFVNATANNFHLQSASPCVDKGTSTGAPDSDIEGIPRPLDGDGANGPAYDMGAYEYAPPSGSIIVRIDPVYAVDAGARWSLDGTTWYPSELRVDYVPVGSRTITFTNVPGWSRPGPYTVTIVAGNVLATNGLYLALSDDTDGDELPDAWEIAHFGRLTNACFSSDFDGDRLPDYYEWRSGTDPCDPASCIIFNEGAISIPPGQGILLRWYSGAGMSFRVCRSTNLVEGFQVIDPAVPATPPMNFYTDQNTTGRAAFFYRIELNQ